MEAVVDWFIVLHTLQTRMFNYLVHLFVRQINAYKVCYFSNCSCAVLEKHNCNTLPFDKIIVRSERLCRRQMIWMLDEKNCPSEKRKHYGIRWKCSLSPLWPFPVLFSKASSSVSLKNPDPKDRIFNRVISDISVVQRENTLAISDSIEAGSPVETEKKDSGFPLSDNTI